MLFDYKRLAKPYSYSHYSNGKGIPRDLNQVQYIVIHNTGGTTDTCRNECDYFATGNTRSAGAHIFVDLDGNAGLSVPLKYTAWHCGGGLQGSEKGSHSYYGKCTNANSVGIELCGIANKYCTAEQIEKTRAVIRWIKKKCPNAQTIIRHWDVTGKDCPHMYKGERNIQWDKLKRHIDS